MDLQSFENLLNQYSPAPIGFRFALREDGMSNRLPAHFHITEVGKVTKQFIDCGGTRRTISTCVLQTLVANDVEHRLTAGKLAKIITHAKILDLPSDLSMEAEVQTNTISLFEISSGRMAEDQLLFELRPKQTACLAPDRCGLEILSNDEPECCNDTGCC